MEDRLERISVAMFFIVLLLIGLNSYRDYGISWDEPIQRLTGIVTAKYVADRLSPSLLDDLPGRVPALSEYQDRDYGVAFEAPAFVLERLLGLEDTRDAFMFRHLLTHLVFLGGVYAVHRMATRRFRDWRIGLLAASFLVLTPRFFAESFYNSKDIVFMALFAIATNTLIAFVLRPTLRTALLHALATSVAIDVRIAAVLLSAATLLLLAVKAARGELQVSRSAWLMCAYAIATGILVVALWPWLWSDPRGNFIQAFVNMSRFRWEGEVLYLGDFIRARNLPWHYSLVWISITTPLLYLGLFAVGCASTIRRLVARPAGPGMSEEELQDLVFLGLLSVPICAVIALHSVLYDGWRHLYFVYPAFVLVAVKGWDVLWNANGTKVFGRAALASVTSVSILYSAYWMWNAHPMQNVYFNALAGEGLKSRFDLDYWGLGSRRALEYVLAHDQHPTINVWADSATMLAYSFMMLKPEERARLKLSNDQSAPFYALTNYRLVKQPDDSRYGQPYDLFYRLKVDNEVILSVYRWRGAQSASTPRTGP